MDSIDKALKEWNESLCESIDVGGLISRNSKVYKWKALFRCFNLRETISWRLHDLLYQSKLLTDSGHILGARILLRSAYETLAVLIHLNQLMRKVISGNLEFHEFSDKTTTLLLGSKDGSTGFESLNIVTILQKCDKKYPGIFDIYKGFCESAHPNHDGLTLGYTNIDYKNKVTNFSNRWAEKFTTSQVEGIALCIKVFFHEYDEEWVEAMTNLEQWITENDDKLEKGKYDA